MNSHFLSPKLRKLSIAFVALGLSGCISVGPNYKKPEIELPEAWARNQQQGIAIKSKNWWKVYNDAELDRLIGEAVAHNADLAVAIARVDEARGLYGVARAAQLPEAGILIGRSKSRSSQNTNIPVPEVVSNNYRVTLEASYEIDIWGKYRRNSEAAKAEFLASEEAREGVMLTLTTEVARAYFSLIALDAQVKVTQRTIETRNQALGLQNKRYTAGVSSEFDLNQIEAEVLATQALLPTLEVQRAQQQNALAVLLGRTPKAIVEENIQRAVLEEKAQTSQLVVPEGLPSDLLLRRPDLREAEQRLIAANARIGVARADYFPSISLTGYLGKESISLSNLFSGPSQIWQAAANLTQPLLSAGRIASQEKVAIAQQQQALAQYNKAVQSSFRDVLNALTAQSAAQTQLDAEEKRSEKLRQALKLANLRYENGLVNQLDILDTERNLLNAELNRIDARRTQKAAIADLIKALGGGWENQ